MTRAKMIADFDAIAEAGYDGARFDGYDFDEIVGGIAMIHRRRGPVLIMCPAGSNIWADPIAVQVLTIGGPVVVLLSDLTPFDADPADAERWVETVQVPGLWPLKISRSDCKKGV